MRQAFPQSACSKGGALQITLSQSLYRTALYCRLSKDDEQIGESTPGHPALPGGLFCAIGNPLSDGTWTYTWQNGRQLKQMQSVDTTASFVYNENGLRVQKTVNGVVTDYTLHGKNIVHMSQGSNTLHFFYDAQNKPAVVVFNGTPYSYVKNLQGDIVAILNSAGTAVVNYVYDAWGRPISKTGSMAGTLGTVQPFRYRSYVFDEENGLYYLRSRYYKATQSRFLNEDSIIRSNLFAYCNNCPVNRSDVNGKESDSISSEWLTIDVSAIMRRYEVEASIQSYSEDRKITSNLTTPYVTVSVLFSRFDTFIEKRVDFSSETDTGCAMFIRGGILNKSYSHSNHVYHAGASSMFRDDLIVKDTIDNIGGPEYLIPGMILGTPMEGEFSDGKYHVEHVGVYAGIRDLGNGPVHAVHSFNTGTHRGNLLSYDSNDWQYFGWHEGIVLD